MNNLYRPSFCSYTLSNPLGSPLGRLKEYLSPFRTKSFDYEAVESGQLVSSKLFGLKKNRQFIPETFPFNSPRRLDKLGIRLKSLLPNFLEISSPLCSLLDINQWHYAYFHWFIDILPRVLSVLDYQEKSGKYVFLLVPKTLKEWQLTSLNLLGFDSSSFFPLDQTTVTTSILSTTLIASPAGRANGLPNAPYDCMSSVVIQDLALKLSSSPLQTRLLGCPKKIYISRNDALSRRIINEDEVVSFLESYGYVSVILDGMPLHQIISLFRTATHIIGVHGAGLTNLLFSENASVIELHAEGHGIRPDYFQLAMIKRLQYCYHVFPSFNKFNDVVVDIQILQTLLDCTAQ